jgi:hypothetical protein
MPATTRNKINKISEEPGGRGERWCIGAWLAAMTASAAAKEIQMALQAASSFAVVNGRDGHSFSVFRPRSAELVNSVVKLYSTLGSVGRSFGHFLIEFSG